MRYRYSHLVSEQRVSVLSGKKTGRWLVVVGASPGVTGCGLGGGGRQSSSIIARTRAAVASSQGSQGAAPPPPQLRVGTLGTRCPVSRV